MPCIPRTSGREKTYARVAEYYYWPGMYKDVAKYVRTCEVCQRYKADQCPPTGLMGARIIERPWQWVAGDIMGPKPRTRRGFEYILVFQDLFTRWVECVPLRRTNAKSVLAELSNRIFLRLRKNVKNRPLCGVPRPERSSSLPRRAATTAAISAATPASQGAISVPTGLTIPGNKRDKNMSRL